MAKVMYDAGFTSPNTCRFRKVIINGQFSLTALPRLLLFCRERILSVCPLTCLSVRVIDYKRRQERWTAKAAEARLSTAGTRKDLCRRPEAEALSWTR